MNIELIEPREVAGSVVQSRFNYQREFIATKCLEMLNDSKIVKVYCDFHDDCVVKYDDGFYSFFQIKGLKEKLTLSMFKNILPKMFENYAMLDGNCDCALATNTILSPELDKIERIKRHIKENIINEEERIILKNITEELGKEIKDEKNLFKRISINL